MGGGGARELLLCHDDRPGDRSASSHRDLVAYEDGRLYLLSGGGDRSDWVRNLRREPRVQLEVGDWRGPATATVVEDAGEDSPARRLLAAKYQGWHEGEPLSEWARTALLVAVDPSEGPA